MSEVLVKPQPKHPRKEHLSVRLAQRVCAWGCLIGLSHLLSVTQLPAAPSSNELKADRWVTLYEETLMPIPLGAHEAAVRLALGEGAWERAADLITPPYADQSVQYLKASLYSKAKAWSKSLEALEGLEADPRLRDAVFTLRAEAALELEEYALCELAASQVSRVDRSLRYESLRYRAKALRELKRWEASAEVSQELLKSDDEGDQAIARLGLALTYLAQGQRERALQTFKELDIHHPTSWSARRAREEVKPLITDQRLKRLWRERSPVEEAQRVKALMEYRKQDEVITDASRLLKTPLPDNIRCELKIVKGRAYDKQRKRSEALKTLEEALTLCEKLRHPDTPLALYVAGRAASLLKRDQTQEALFWRLFKDYRHRLSDDAAVFLIRHYNEVGVDFQPPAPPKNTTRRAKKKPKKKSGGKVRGRAKKGQGKKRRGSKGAQRADRSKRAKRAARRFEPRWLEKIMEVARLVPKLHPDGDMSAEALNFAFVAAMRAKNTRYAREVLKLAEGLKPFEFSFYHSGLFSYWRGRLASDAQRHKEAREHYVKAINSAPISWYALLAYSRLYERDRAFADEVAQASVERAQGALGLPGGEGREWGWRLSKHDPHWPSLERSMMWLRLGLERRGRQELTELARDQRRPDLQWLSAWILDTYELYHWSHDIPRRQLVEYRHFPTTGSTKKHWQLAYPAPFSSEVMEAAEPESIDPHFIWGVMREESGFAKGVRSHASAVGLLQLLVPTANMMVRRGEQKVSAEDLSKPRVNVRLGARYLNWVRRNAEVPLPLVPAGYNAGHGALKRWLRARGDLPLDLFVETIPYQEARWYLKRVNASWVTYKTLYRDKRAPGEGFWPYVGQATRKKDKDTPSK